MGGEGGRAERGTAPGCSNNPPPPSLHTGGLTLTLTLTQSTAAPQQTALVPRQVNRGRLGPDLAAASPGKTRDHHTRGELAKTRRVPANRRQPPTEHRDRAAPETLPRITGGKEGLKAGGAGTPGSRLQPFHFTHKGSFVQSGTINRTGCWEGRGAAAGQRAERAPFLFSTASAALVQHRVPPGGQNRLSSATPVAGPALSGAHKEPLALHFVPPVFLTSLWHLAIMTGLSKPS